MPEIKTNDRFDKLTNLDISTYHRESLYYFMLSDFLGAFAYWVVVQSPYDTPDITPALKAFAEYVKVHVAPGRVEGFSYSDLGRLINEDVFESIPEIEKLNHRKNGREAEFGFCSRYHQPDPDDDFIDLGALARNVFFMMLRESITQDQ